MAWIVVRVRGSIHARHDLVQTLDQLHLTRPNHATVVPEVGDMRGMLTKVQGYITWGEAEPETIGKLLKERGETPEGQKLGEAKNLEELSKSVLSVGLARTAGVKPLFRLRAPKGGWKSTKKPFAYGGALGYRGRAVNDLALRMM